MVLKYAQFQVGLLQFVGPFGKLRIKLYISRIYLRLSTIYVLVLLCCYATLNRSSLWVSGEMQEILLEDVCIMLQAARNILAVTEDVSMTVVQKSVTAWSEPGG